MAHIIENLLRVPLCPHVSVGKDDAAVIPDHSRRTFSGAGDVIFQNSPRLGYLSALVTDQGKRELVLNGKRLELLERVTGDTDHPNPNILEFTQLLVELNRFGRSSRCEGPREEIKNDGAFHKESSNIKPPLSTLCRKEECLITRL